MLYHVSCFSICDRAEKRLIMSLIALIPAGGVGARALDEQHSAPKQYRVIAAKSLLQHAVDALLSDARVELVHIGVAADDPYIESDRKSVV